MAVTFFLRTTKTTGTASLYVAVKSPNTNFQISTPLKVDIETYTKAGGIFGGAYTKVNKEAEHKVYNQAEEINKRINNTIKDKKTISKETAIDIIEDVCFREERKKRQEAEEAKRKAEEKRQKDEEERKKREAEANRMTLQKYLDTYIGRIESGDIKVKGEMYSYYTIKSIKYSINLFNKFQSETGYLDFNTIDTNTFGAYSQWMEDKKYAKGAIGARIKDIKSILARAHKDGYNDNMSYSGIEVLKEEKDSIYLTQEELNAITNVNPKDFPDEFPHPDQAEKFRDVFLIGCYSGQRISDYGHIQHEQITEETIDGVKTIYIGFHQHKTGEDVQIPCMPKLVELLNKYRIANDNGEYEYNLPQVKFEQQLNKCIKDIAKVAGITTPVTTTIVKGGKKETERKPKYKLISSHTARRTFASLMLLNGVPKDQIAQCTGHKSIKQLETYIRADKLTQARALAKHETFKKGF